jgi:hypothetical protein
MPNTEQTKQDRGHTHDTDEPLVLPRPMPEVTEDDDEKRADTAFDDLEIDLDDEDVKEVKAESDNQPSGRKY